MDEELRLNRETLQKMSDDQRVRDESQAEKMSENGNRITALETTFKIGMGLLTLAVTGIAGLVWKRSAGGSR